MIDALLQPIQARLLAPPAGWLHRRGVSADSVTAAGFVLGLAGFAALAAGVPLAGLALVLANRLADGLDGAIARIAGPTRRGAFLDIAFDFMVYALVPFGFALADPASNALAAAALVTAFMGTGSSFLAFAAVAAGDGRPAPAARGKGIAYLGGLTEGTETIALFVAMCLWPVLFPALAWGFAAACLLTTASRWHRGWTVFAPATGHARSLAEG